MIYPFKKHLKQEHILVPGFVLMDKEQAEVHGNGAATLYGSDTIASVIADTKGFDEIENVLNFGLRVNLTHVILSALIESPKKDPRKVLEGDGAKYAVCSTQYSLLQSNGIMQQQDKYGLICKSFTDLRLIPPRIIFHKGGVVYLTDDMLYVIVH